MVNKDIVNYLKDNLRRGLSIEEVRQQLLTHNYSDYDIDSAINTIDLSDIPKKEEIEKEKEIVKDDSLDGWDEMLE